MFFFSWSIVNFFFLGEQIQQVTQEHLQLC